MTAPTLPTGQVKWRIDAPTDDVRVTFVPDAPILNLPGVTAVVADGHLTDPDGTQLVTLAATDTTNPAGWTWTAHLRVDGRLVLSFPFTLPAGTVLDLADRVPVSASRGVPIVQGPPGPAGPAGPQGPAGPPGDGDLDAIGTSSATPNTVVRRGPDANADFGVVAIGNPPTAPFHATPKDYVDTRLDARTTDDWNNAVAPGWYSALDVPNAPVTGNLSVLTEMTGPHQYWLTQTAYNFGANITDGISLDTWRFRRHSHHLGGNERGWTAWYRLRDSEAELNRVLGTPNREPDTIVRRDAYMGFNASYIAGLVEPSQPDSATNREYVDAIGQSGAVPDTVVRRNAAGDSAFHYLTVEGVGATQPAVNSYDLVRKDYVDGLIAALEARISALEGG